MQAFQLEPDVLSPTLVFDYPSIEAIAAHLLPLLPPPPPIRQAPAAVQLAAADGAVMLMAGRAPAAERAPQSLKRAAPPANPNAPTLTGCGPHVCCDRCLAQAAAAVFLSFRATEPPCKAAKRGGEEGVRVSFQRSS